MWFGFIYTCYKKKRKTAFWFEMVYIARRLVLSMIIALYPSTGLFRSILVVGLLLVSLEVYIIVRPYASR